MYVCVDKYVTIYICIGIIYEIYIHILCVFFILHAFAENKREGCTPWIPLRKGLVGVEVKEDHVMLVYKVFF